jgi:mono/diheme cytochrome c family protein
MKRVAQLTACAAALALVVAVAAIARGAQAHGKQTTTPINPAVTYAKNCATCHGKDGRSKTFKGKHKGTRDLTDAQWQADVTDERVFNSISNGKGKMPAFRKKLTTEQIESLVAYVRGLKK